MEQCCISSILVITFSSQGETCNPFPSQVLKCLSEVSIKRRSVQSTTPGWAVCGMLVSGATSLITQWCLCLLSPTSFRISMTIKIRTHCSFTSSSLMTTTPSWQLRSLLRHTSAVSKKSEATWQFSDYLRSPSTTITKNALKMDWGRSIFSLLRKVLEGGLTA